MKEDSKKGESRSIEILYFYTFWKTVQEKNKVEWLCSKEYKRAKVRMGLNNFRNGDKENLLFIEQRADGKIIFNLDKSLGIVKSASFILLR